MTVTPEQRKDPQHGPLPGGAHFPDGLAIPADDQGAKVTQDVVSGNAQHGVTWVHSYINPERTSTYCIYDGPSPEAIRDAAETTGLPVDRITEVSVLDPYFYH